MSFIEIPGFVPRMQKNENTTTRKETAVSGNDAVRTEETDADTMTAGKADADTAVEEADIAVEDMESLTLAEDTLTYIAVTNTCIAFGVFLLVGLILVKIAWGRFK